jgi:hypothetical protein
MGGGEIPAFPRCTLIREGKCSFREIKISKLQIAITSSSKNSSGIGDPERVTDTSMVGMRAYARRLLSRCADRAEITRGKFWDAAERAVLGATFLCRTNFK